MLEGLGKEHHRQVDGEATGVDPEGGRTDVIEGEPEEQVLEVDALPCPGQLVEDHEQLAVHQAGDGSGRVLHEAAGVHLAGGRAALLLPRLVVRVEDAVAEELGEALAVVSALGKVGEAGLEDVLDFSRVDRHDAVAVAEPHAAEGEGAAGAGDGAGGPLVDVV